MPTLLQSVARFGLDRLESVDGGRVSPLTGFLALVVVSFDSIKAAEAPAAYRSQTQGGTAANQISR